MIRERVIAVFAKRKGISSELIGSESTFRDLGMDSLDALEVLFDLEEEFDISIPNGIAEGLENIGQVIERVSELCSGSAGDGPHASSPTVG
jgi:acyl carrier protein